MFLGTKSGICSDCQWKARHLFSVKQCGLLWTQCICVQPSVFGSVENILKKRHIGCGKLTRLVRELRLS